MKRLYTTLAITLLLLLSVPYTASALFIVPQGGTGSNVTPAVGQVLVGQPTGRYAPSSTISGSITVTGTTTLATTTVQALNDVIYVTGNYPKNSAGITAAFAAASARGAHKVRLVEGTYSISTHISVPTLIDFGGAGKGRTILNDTSGSFLDYMFTVDTKDRVSIHDMSLVGNGSFPPTGLTPGNAINANGSTNLKLYSLSFSRFDNAAINIQESGSIAASSTEIYDIDADCTVGAPIFVSDDITSAYAVNTSIHDNHLCGNDSAIAVFNSTSTKVWANFIDKRGAIGGQGIEVGSAGLLSRVNDFQAWNNTVVGATANDIYVVGTTTGAIMANDVSLSKNNGILISTIGGPMRMISNYSHDNYRDGILVIGALSRNVTRPIISQNIAANNGREAPGYCGVELNSQSSGSVVGAFVNGNVFMNDQPSQTQQFGLCLDNETGAQGNNTGHTITENTFVGNPQALKLGTTHASAFGPMTIFGNSGATTSIDAFNLNGKMGIGTSTPATALDVNGLIRVYQTSTTTCSASVEGSIFYSSTGKHFYGCNGVTWNQLD